MKIAPFLFFFTAFLICEANTTPAYATTAGEEDAPNMVLSNETNSLRSGVWVNNSDHVIIVKGGNVIGEASLIIFNTSSNGIDFWEFLNLNSAYQINLTDEKGNIVPKTSYGESFGHSPKKNPKGAWVIEAQSKYGLHAGKILPEDDFFVTGIGYDPIKGISKCFELKKPGNYKLTLIHKIFLGEFRTNRFVLKPVVFSPVTINVRVEK